MSLPQAAKASPFAHLAGQAARIEPPAATISETAKAIIRAGAIRRGEIMITDTPAPPVGTVATAAEIVAAARKARGEVAA